MRAFTQLRGLVAMRGRGAGDGGFTMVELMVAMGVILATLTTMVTTTISSFGAIGIAKQRQVCTSLANETVEEVRGLPFATLTRGLGLTDLQAGGDSAITSSVVSGVTTYFYGGEPIPTAGLTLDDREGLRDRVRAAIEALRARVDSTAADP